MNGTLIVYLQGKCFSVCVVNISCISQAELERKLEAAVRSKSHYKQQWGRTLRELAKSRQREQQMAKQALRKQEQVSTCVCKSSEHVARVSILS